MLPFAIPDNHSQPGDPLERFYTPQPLADAVVEWVVEALGPHIWHKVQNTTFRVAEPSVGGGAFVRAIRRTVPNCQLWGCDTDPAAAGLQMLEEDPNARACRGDYETMAWNAVARDLVIGNPPFSRWVAHVLATREELPMAWLAFILPVEHVCTKEGDAFLARHPLYALRPIVGRPWPKSIRGTAVYVWAPVDAPPSPCQLVTPGIGL